MNNAECDNFDNVAQMQSISTSRIVLSRRSELFGCFDHDKAHVCWLSGGDVEVLVLAKVLSPLYLNAIEGDSCENRPNR